MSDNGARPDDTLTPEQAALLLGVSSRTVWRWITHGKLAGTRQPCRTTRSAVDAYLTQRQPRSGQLLTQSLTADRHEAEEEEEALRSVSAAALVAAMLSDLSEARQQIEHLARENGRLEAELAQYRRPATGDGRQREGTHAVGRHTARVWGRVGLWLRR
jgi:excisionase family DNA binding protein